MITERLLNQDFRISIPFALLARDKERHKSKRLSMHLPIIAKLGSLQYRHASSVSFLLIK